MESLIKEESVILSDEDSFFGLVGEHKRTLYGIAYSYLRSEADALEMVQEATCRAWVKRKSLKDEGRFTPWLSLTFKITNYPSPILEEHSIRIR
ncbi:RNA polymerase sigma factor [Paenibacillus zanthoxyli]|uniref:RNA polymerase sigma factor n=1 Tax=Paenibacillus zanthoxyli TaxID=369399 RepID=UPI0004B3C9D3|nr:sigma factor [Paenibacillus zanthoxyli]